MNWIKGQPTENGQYHVIYKLFNHKNNEIVTELHIATVDKVDSYKKGAYFISNTKFEISESKILAYQFCLDIPSEFYDDEK